METLGALVKEWRRQSGLSRPELARLVREASEHDSPGARVQRQHIDQLEAAGSRSPRYIGELAKAMGTTVDDLLALRMPPPLQMAAGGRRDVGAPPPLPPVDFSDRRVVSDTDWALLQDVKLLDERSLHEVREKARLIREAVDRLVSERLRAVGSVAAPPGPAPPALPEPATTHANVAQMEQGTERRMGDRRRRSPFEWGKPEAVARRKLPNEK